MDQRKDYGEVRENLKEVIDNSKNAIDGILKVASESDSPRAYEVVSQLLKTATEANKELLDVHKQMKDLEKDETKNGYEQCLLCWIYKRTTGPDCKTTSCEESEED